MCNLSEDQDEPAGEVELRARMKSLYLSFVLFAFLFLADHLGWLEPIDSFLRGY